jgi:hypothetical protein
VIRGISNASAGAGRRSRRLQQGQRRPDLREFKSGRLRGFTETGTFLDLEIPSGKVVRRTSLGPPGSLSKSVFTDGARYTANDVPRLAPNGRYVAINTPDKGAKIYLME